MVSDGRLSPSGDKARWEPDAARISRGPFRGGTGCGAAYRAYLRVFVRKHSAGFCGIGGLYVRVMGIGILMGRRFNNLGCLMSGNHEHVTK